MGQPVTSNAQRVATTALNTKVNKEAFDSFKDYCKELGYPMNVMLEPFMQQYANGRFHIDEEEVMKFKRDNTEVDTLSTSFNKEIYNKFKLECKKNRLFVKHVLSAFMETVTSREFILEYKEID